MPGGSHMQVWSPFSSMNHYTVTLRPPTNSQESTSQQVRHEASQILSPGSTGVPQLSLGQVHGKPRAILTPAF